MRLLPLQGMSVGEGDVYSCFEKDCYDKVMAVLNDPTHELYQMIDEAVGVNYLRSALLSMSPAPEYNVYYDPDNVNSKWDLMGEYSDLVEIMAFLGGELDVDCNLDARLIINSHQGTAGM